MTEFLCKTASTCTYYMNMYHCSLFRTFTTLTRTSCARCGLMRKSASLINQCGKYSNDVADDDDEFELCK